MRRKKGMQIVYKGIRVATLIDKGDKYVFQYCKSNIEKAMDKGFELFSGYSNENEKYESSSIPKVVLDICCCSTMSNDNDYIWKMLLSKEPKNKDLKLKWFNAVVR